jgi:hypothetical protein
MLHDERDDGVRLATTLVARKAAFHRVEKDDRREPADRMVCRGVPLFGSIHLKEFNSRECALWFKSGLRIELTEKGISVLPQ